MSSISNNSADSVIECISRLKRIRDEESQRIYNFWDNYVKVAQAPGATVESITLTLAKDDIPIDQLIPQNERVSKTHFPKNLKTLEEYQHHLEEFKGRQKLNSSTWYRWDGLVKTAYKEGMTFEIIKAAVEGARGKKENRKNNNVKGVESSAAAAAAGSSEVKLSGSPTPRASTHVVNPKTKAPKKDADLRQKVAPSTHGSRGPETMQVPADVSSGFYSNYTRPPPQTSTTKAIAAPINKPQPKPPVPATSTTSHSHLYPHSHPQFQSHSHSSSVSSARKQQQVVTSDRQRPRTPTKSTAPASASRDSPRKTVKSPTTTHTSHTVSKHSGQRVTSSPLNSPQKRKLSVSSGGASMPNQSGQSKQPNQVQAVPPVEDTWDLGMFLEEETQGFDSLRNEFEMHNSFYDPYQRQ